MPNKENDEPTTHRRDIDPGSSQSGSHQNIGATRITTIKSGGPPRGQDPGNPASHTIIHGNEPNHTVLHRPPPPPGSAGHVAESVRPVTGWLVAVKGPGRGKARSVFEGLNSAGRDPGQPIPLDFDDPEISREKHFFITYEPKKRTFHISIGEKANLVYLNGEVVLAPMVLADGAEIEVGRTKLRFVALCGPGFSWDET
jgi:FHA domain-containing protein